MAAPESKRGDRLFPTTVVGSMPRPQYIKDLVEAEVEAAPAGSDFQKMMDAAVPYVVQMQERWQASTSSRTASGAGSRT